MADSEPDCIFCAIVRGDAESSRIYEDDSVLVFLVLQPVNPGHMVVIPKAHFEGLADLDEEIGMQIFKVGQAMAGLLRGSGLRCEGIDMFVADGAAAFQEVFHFHLHVFPRWEGDDFRLSADWRYWSRAELDGVADQLRAAL